MRSLLQIKSQEGLIGARKKCQSRTPGHRDWGDFAPRVVPPVLDELILDDREAGSFVLDPSLWDRSAGRRTQRAGLSGHQRRRIGGESVAYARDDAPGSECLVADARSFTRLEHVDAVLWKRMCLGGAEGSVGIVTSIADRIGGWIRAVGGTARC